MRLALAGFALSLLAACICPRPCPCVPPTPVPDPPPAPTCGLPPCGQPPDVLSAWAAQCLPHGQCRTCPGSDAPICAP